MLVSTLFSGNVASVRTDRCCLRGERFAHATDDAITLVDIAGEHTITPGWKIERIELSPSGSFVLARGDSGKRVGVWMNTGERVFTAQAERTQGVAANLIAVDGTEALFVHVDKEALQVLSLPSKQPRNTMLHGVPHVIDAVAGLVGAWLAVRGHQIGEGYETVLAVNERVRRNTDVTTWGYSVALGPAGDGHAVTFRDAELDPDGLPDEPDEAFEGFAVWDLATATATQRIPFKGDIPDGSDIGADATRIAIKTARDVLVIDRASAEMKFIPAVAFDPYRMTVARVEEGRLTVSLL